MDYSVAIVLGSFTLHFLTIGVMQSFGLMYSELLDYFDEGRGDTGWISSLNNGIMMLSGPLAGAITSKIGCRSTFILGSILAALGLGSGLFVTSMFYLYLTYGIIAGFGFGLESIVKMAIVNQHCDKRRSLAMGFAASGSGVGTIVLPLLINRCLKLYGWRGSFLILSGVCLQGVVFGALFRPPQITMEKKINKTLNELSETGSTNTKVCKADDESISFMHQCISLLRNVTFDVFLFGGALISMVFILPFVMLPDMIVKQGLTREQAAIVVTSAGISGIFGRILVGLIADIQGINRCVLHGLITITGGGATIACGFMKSFSAFVVYGILLGIFSGTFAVLQPVIVTDIVRKQSLSAGLGLMSFAQGILVLIGTPIGGWISDWTGSYREAFYFAGVTYICGGLILLCIPIVAEFKAKLNRPKNNYSINSDTIENPGWISDWSGSYKEAFLFAGVAYICGGIVLLSIPLTKKKKNHNKQTEMKSRAPKQL